MVSEDKKSSSGYVSGTDKGSTLFNFFGEYWTFVKKYYNEADSNTCTEEFWHNMAQESIALTQKYSSLNVQPPVNSASDGRKFVEEILLATIRWFDDRARDRQSEPEGMPLE